MKRTISPYRQLLHGLSFSLYGKQFLDGMERTSIGMYITIGGLLLNIFLNWVLIYGRLGTRWA
jgi:Na+-driven multidrug efflux pump